MADSTSGHEPDRKRFPWTVFYEAVAEKLLDHQFDRKPLVKAIHDITGQHGLRGYTDKNYPEDETGFPMENTCPYTAMGTFNRLNVGEEKRKCVALGISGFLGVEVAVPASFEGVPCLGPAVLWPFRYAYERIDDDGNDHDVDDLWRVFVAAAKFVDSDLPENRKEFIEAFNDVAKIGGAGWSLTAALFWAHPWNLPTLDKKSRCCTEKLLGKKIKTIKVPNTDRKSLCSGEDYLKLTDKLREGFEDNKWSVRSFPALACAALGQK